MRSSPLGRVLISLVILCTAALSPTTAATQPDETRPPDMTCALRVRDISQWVLKDAFANKEQRLPADMHALLLARATDPAVSLHNLAQAGLVSPAHDALLDVPADPTPDWINNHSSYRYIGNADVSLEDIPEWSTLVIAHLRLDKGHAVEPTPDNPEGEVFTLAFLDGHVELLGRADAERRISESTQVFDALRTGADLPDDRQAQYSLSLIMRAIRAYAQAHNQRLPSDLGATLDFVPVTRATATPAQRARVFLPPRAQKSTPIPEHPTPEWVNTHTRYVYLGNADLRLDAIPQPFTIVLVHTRSDDAISVAALNGDKHDLLTLGLAGGNADNRPIEYARWVIGESERTFRALRRADPPDPLPDWIHSASDLSILATALTAYSKAHDGALPPTLPATLDHLPDTPALPLTPRDRALLFLSPNAQWTAAPPENPTPEWIAKNATYVYLPIGSPRLAADALRGNLIVAHTPLHESYKIMSPIGVTDTMELDVVPCISALGDAFLAPREWAIEQIAESNVFWRTLADAPMPD